MSGIIINPYVYAPTGLADIDNAFSMEFDGINDEVVTGITTGTNDISISCWMKTTEINPTSANRCAFGGMNGGGGANVGIGRMTSLWSAPDDMLVRVLNTYGTTKLNDGDWHNIIYTADYTTKEMKAYVDGNTTPEATTTIYAWSTYFHIAIGWDNQTMWFNGNVDECAYWDYILSPSDIEDIYNATSSGKTADLSSMSTPPILWYRMGD